MRSLAETGLPLGAVGPGDHAVVTDSVSAYRTGGDVQASGVIPHGSPEA